MMTPRKVLGLAVAEQSITAVEVGVGHGRRKVLRAAEMSVPEGVASQEPAVLGKALRQFLRREHFAASHCVIGLGARWLVAKEKVLPPTAPDLLAGVLTIAAEREFASDAEDLVVDFCDLPAAGEGQRVLLVAASRRNVDQMAAAAAAAGLKVEAITSSTIGLAAATRRHASSWRLVLNLAPCGAELCVQVAGAVRILRRLSLPPCGVGAPSEAWIGDLAGELRRVVALLPGEESARDGLELLVWNASGLSAGALDVLGQRVSLAARVCVFPADLEMDGAPQAVPGEFAAAAALAAAGLDRKLLAADFLHSRLNPPKKTALGNKVAWGAGIGAALIVAAAVLVWDWQSAERQSAGLAAQLKSKQSQYDAARAAVDRMNAARGWYSDYRPKFLDCLVGVTRAFPDDGRVWAVSLAIGEDMRLLLTGKATNQASATELVDRLSKDPKFAKVESQYIREVGAGTTDVSFAISLTFANPEAK